MDVKETVRTHSKPLGEEGRNVGLSMNEHHYELWKWGIGHISIDQVSSILDVGCGGGRAISILAGFVEKGKVYGIDYSVDMVKLATETNRGEVDKGNVIISQSSVSELPFPDGMFDIVTAFETCYFWPNIEEDLREIRRVLKKDSLLLIVNEMYEHSLFEERNAAFNAVEGMNIYSADDYRTMLEGAGFSSVTIDEFPVNNWICIVAKN
ncbi:class I SAM-dependent methyltransferase [Methanolobus sp. ZRKC3]|uniref:class I SAM-dependent methyltransferase n=1 Tax=Methanolobus sp. ZRKC3 TaxID=3125786 RepID=UPI00324D9950